MVNLRSSPHSAAKRAPEGSAHSSAEDQAIGGRSGVSISDVGGALEGHGNANGTGGIAPGRLAIRGGTPVAIQAERSQVARGQQPFLQGGCCACPQCDFGAPSCIKATVAASAEMVITARAGRTPIGTISAMASTKHDARRMSGERDMARL
jgi:hypothetical protein